MPSYDVVIVGASFAGLTLAHHLPRTLRVLVVDAKPAAGATVESTGLITSKTREEFRTFFDVDRYITNPITGICVVAPDFAAQFVSRVREPWIFQTDTKALVRALADALPPNVELRTATVFLGVDDPERPTRVTLQSKGRAAEEVECRFLVGADGGHSKVAQSVAGLWRNRRFLFGHEQVFFGTVHLGPDPEETISHFWFGEFSLGYGGWISPTVVDGRPAFRIGLAKLMEDRGDARRLTVAFLHELRNRGYVTVEGDIEKPDYVFGSHIPIGGCVKRIHAGNALLIGDAAGFCGAFAADGIKGSVVSGKEAAPLIERYLAGDASAPGELAARMNRRTGLIGYYRRQLLYRFVWDRMKSDRSFWAMFRIIEQERDTFLEQFCDSKDRRKSLSRVVLKPRHAGRLLRYAWSLTLDLFR